ncbi:Major facilitator superfamily domain, general substrate transporter [Akanthomyces lecanii RCEF 1005]|uniref:Major facilitator superfamily domain, general substrate transporter n=1 Tax=Akanthomyces lecanii RCEF 1005 TaxID=1081108 RepID=A0A168I606_CORDF|nr:Major facilitator superfamily domain, general substrate transporter [Akanthomyces lecanii RCEF 1005]
MLNNPDESAPDELRYPPGTVVLVSRRDSAAGVGGGIVLSPAPSDNPNDPLMWSAWRKSLNFAQLSAMSIIISTSIAMQPVFWAQMRKDIGASFQEMANSLSCALVGLAIGCLVFIPFTIKYGRRSSFVLPTAIIAITAWWAAYMKTVGELYVTALLFGLAGATSQTAIEMSINDLFYVHQRATANGVYVATIMVGNFLVPMAAGAEAVHMGWRACFKTLAASVTALVVIMVFALEETKFVRDVDVNAVDAAISAEGVKDDEAGIAHKAPETASGAIHCETQTSRVPKTYWQRLRFFTTTPESLWTVAKLPFYTFWFPHVAFSSLQLAAVQTFYSVLSSSTSIIFSSPPYNFNAAQIGYMSTGLCIGAILGAVYGGYFTDRAMLWFARRNNGVFEPEMRLYLLPLPAVTMLVGLIVNGFTADKGMHWIYPSIGRVIFGFGNSAATDTFFTIVIDAFPALVGQTFVSVVFFQNALSIAGPFAIETWRQNMGITNMFITAAVLGLLINALAIPLVIWGKRARIAVAPRYHQLAKAGLRK